MKAKLFSIQILATFSIAPSKRQPNRPAKVGHPPHIMTPAASSLRRHAPQQPTKFFRKTAERNGKRRKKGFQNEAETCRRNKFILSLHPQSGSLAQLVQSVTLQAEGRGFESLSSHRSGTKTTCVGVVFVFQCPANPVLLGTGNRDFCTGYSCLPAILLRNRSPTDRAASSGNAGRKATP